MLECGHIALKFIDQRRSAIKAAPQDLITRHMVTKAPRGLSCPLGVRY
jgi:hypothetical protein